MKHLLAIIFLCLVQVLSASTQDIENYLKKGDEILTILKNNKQKDTLHNLEDKNVAKIFAQMSKLQTKIKSKTYLTKEMGDLINVSDKINQIQMSYMTHGLKSIIKKTDTRKDIQLKLFALMEKNFIKYQNEFEITYPFILNLFSKESKLIVSFWKTLAPKDKTQIRKDGIRKMRKGISQLYLSAIMTLQNKVIKKSFYNSMLNSAKNASYNLSQILPLNERGIILKILIKNKKIVQKEYKDDFGVIIKAFSSKECNEICKIN